MFPAATNLDPWKWAGRSRDGKHKAYVHAPTYLEAQKAACRKFGFVVRKFDSDECEVWKVEVEAAIEGRKPFADSGKAAA